MDICIGRYFINSSYEPFAYFTTVLGGVVSSGFRLLCTQISFYGNTVRICVCVVDRVGKKAFQPERSYIIMTPGRIVIGIICIAGLIAVFLFQQIDVAAFIGVDVKLTRFLINRTIRFLLNDALALGLIYALFQERKYVIFALYVQIAGIFLFLVPYFILKIFLPTYNGPLISFLHRLILNPTLLMLLIPAFYYQRQIEKRKV